MKITESYLGERVKGFLPYAQIADIDFVDPEDDDEVVFDERKDSSSVLFDEIFAVNPLTKLPDGDIAVFMNENTSESVRNFIIQNLTNDNGEVSDSSNFADLDDDVIALYTRGSDESIEHYRDRIFDDIKNSRRSRSDGSKS